MKMGFKLQSWFRRRRSREEKITGMGLTVTEDTPADMLAGSMELLVQLPPDHHIHTQRVTVERSTAMMDLLVQIATAHKLAASSYTLQAIGERGLVLPHQSNTPIGALDALEVKLLPKQGTFIPRKTKQPSQPFETTFRLQVHLPRNQLYVSRVSPKTNLGDILDEVCREKNLDKNKYELRHPGNHKETLDLSLSLQDYHLQEVTLYAKQGQNLGSALSSQDIMALQRQEERRRQQAKQSVFGFIFKKSKESSLSTDSLGGRSVSPARSDETGRSVSPLTVPTRPQRKRRPAPNPPTSIHQTAISPKTNGSAVKDESKEKLVISHSRNSSDSSGYHEASVLSDNPDSAGRMPETLPRRSKPPGKFETRKLAQTSQTSKSLCNLATNAGAGLTHAISNTSLSSTGIRKKRAAPKPPTNRPLSSAISIQALERIVDSEESLTSDMGISKPPSDIAVSSETETNSKANSDISMNVHASTTLLTKNFLHNGTVETDDEKKIHHTTKSDHRNCHMPALQAERIASESIGEAEKVEIARVAPRAPVPMPRSTSRGPTITPRRILNISSSPLSAVASTSIIEYESGKVDISGDSHQENQESRGNQNIVQIEIENMNDEGIIKKEKESIIEPQLKSYEDAYDHVSSNADVLDSSITLDGTENPSSKEVDNSLESNQSCEIIATVPKSPHILEQLSGTSPKSVDTGIRMNEMLNDSNEKSLLEVSKNPFQSEVSQHVSDISHFEMNSSEKSYGKPTSEEEIITCTLESNLSTKISQTGIDRKMELVMESPRKSLSENDNPSDEQYPPFITHSTNLGLQMDLTHSTVEEKLHSQRTGKAGVDGSRTVTDLLLQEVSTTLANVSPTSERLSQDVASNEVNYVEETDRIDSKTDVTQADTETGSDSAPNTTVHSQQNTSDYVSATGEDLSAADWEYQLPDPPSAFRDNVARDREVYDTIALSSTDAFREPIITQTHPMENNANSYENAQRKSQDVIVAVPNSTLSKTTTYLMNEKSDEHHPVKSTIEEDVITPRLSPEDRQKSSDEDLRKDVICELSNKIENRISNAPNCKNSEEEYRQSANHKSAPEIAPTENTLPNFKITTYPRQKSSNMYEPLAPMSSYLTDRSQDRIINTFATLSRNMSAIPTKKESYLESSHRNYHLANHNKINDAPITRTHSVHHINSTSEKFVDPIQEVIQIPIKERDFADNVDKNNVVHRSKSYIVLSHNSKYRGKKILVPNATDEGRMLKSTSVTSLNHESAKVNEETVQNCNANTQICQNGKREDRELQSVQILKSILPQLKTNQQFDRVIPGDAATKCHTEEKKPTTQSEDTDEVQLRNKTGSGIEEKKTEPQVTDKRWRYTGPPAISLGSWSERPCVNVKIKMDTDYKFGINNNNNNNISTNNSNITGAKTVVNLNSTSNDVDIVNYKDSFMKNVPKNDVKLSSNDTKEPNIKRMADDVGAAKKKITNTTLNQMESGPNNFGFAKLRTVQRETRDKPVVVNDAATKKSHLEEADTKDDDIKIDTRPVNFKELTQTFGQVNLRVKPKCYSQNRHSDYFDARPSGNDLVDNRIAKISTNDNINGIHRSSIKRYTSVIGIDAQSPTNLKKKSDEIKKIHMTTTNVNGPIPIVKGFKINHPTEIPRVQSFSSSQKNSFAGSNKIYSHNPPPPPTMPVITGVTLKSHNAAMKPVSSCTDPRDELLESIRSFRRDKMRSVDTVF